MRTPFGKHEKEPDLLRTYLVKQSRWRTARAALGFTAFGAAVGFACWYAVRYRDATWLGVIAGALALVGLIVVGLGWAVGCYWLGSTYAKAQIRTGATRPALLHGLTILAIAGVVAIPFGGFVLWDESLWRFWLVYGWVTWHTASSCTLGYVSPFWFRPSP